MSASASKPERFLRIQAKPESETHTIGMHGCKLFLNVHAQAGTETQPAAFWRLEPTASSGHRTLGSVGYTCSSGFVAALLVRACPTRCQAAIGKLGSVTMQPMLMRLWNYRCKFVPPPTRSLAIQMRPHRCKMVLLGSCCLHNVTTQRFAVL